MVLFSEGLYFVDEFFEEKQNSRSKESLAPKKK